ncbi:hypothetical protein [Cupriavidus sp. DL-D2]|uniref:hypothetical protein n=1 Tax=Cupriavidus sp. DL-D2 TaxID=3144974 RepID=UPI0032154966
MTIQFQPREVATRGYPWTFVYFHGDAQSEVSRVHPQVHQTDLVVANIPRPNLAAGETRIERGTLFGKNVTAHLWADHHGEMHGLVCSDTDRGSCEYAERKMQKLEIYA